MPGTEHQPNLLHLHISTDAFPVFKFQNSEFLQPPLLSSCVKICKICAVTELIGRQFIILLTPLPVEQSQEAILNFSGWISKPSSPPANLSWLSLLSICHFRRDHSSFPPVLAAPFPLILTSSSADPVVYRGEWPLSWWGAVRKAAVASFSLQLQHHSIRSASAAATFTLPPPTHSCTATHTLACASRQAQGPRTLLGSRSYWLSLSFVRKKKRL